MKKTWMIVIVVALVCIVVGVVIFLKYTPKADENVEVEVEKKLLYGFAIDDYNIYEGTIESGTTLSSILGSYDISAAQIDEVSKVSEPIYDLRQIRAGHPYTVFLTPDDKGLLQHFVYEQDVENYVVFSFLGDSISVHTEAKPVTIVRTMDSACIESSLWNAMVDNNIDAKMAMDLSEIFSWTIDFFSLQPGDSFKVIYDRKYIDSTSIGSGNILGAWFENEGKRYYAIPYQQDGRKSYWDEKGNSLRKNVLKAPLKFSRISSKFSNSRMHPVLRIRRPHHGVDYAAPAGTPVFAVADGMVIMRGYGGGGGNTVKIQHAKGLKSGYLHLRGFAKGLTKGKRVRQGELIGYVGSTGLSTGPHLDFRIWQNGTAIDPLKIPSTPTEPIRKSELTNFNLVRDRVLAALNGTMSIEELDVDGRDNYVAADSVKSVPFKHILPIVNAKNGN